MNYWSIHLENGTCSEKNTSASQTPDSSRTDATLKKWKSLWARSENVILQNIVKFNDALYAISDGKLVECGTNSYNVIDTESVLGSNETIVKLVSQFDLLLSLDSLGNVFIASPQNITDLNAKSDETAEKSIQFVKIELIQGHTRCVHGVNCTPERRISAKDISCTRVSVYIVDQLGNVWTFKRDGQQSFAHKFGNSRRVEVSKLPFPDYKIVRNVFCGSGHCIALVDNNQNLDSSSREEQMETNSQNKTCDAVENSSPACEKCVEEGNNRLSFLMESANEVPSTSSSSTPRERGGNADSNSPAISRSSAPTSRPSPRSAQNSPAPSPAQNAVVARLEGLRTWNFRRGTKCPKDSVALAKSSKLGQKSITYSQKTASLGQSSSSWRKQQRLAKHNSLDIELSTLGQGTISSRSQNDSEKQSSQNISTDLTGSIQFSFVSLDNVLASSTDDSGSTAATISDSDLAYSSSSPSGQSTSCLLQPSPNQAVKKHTQPIICDDRSNEILIVKNCAENMRLTNVSNVEQFSELWSWGENQCGQLGLSDTVARKEPQKIRLLPNGPISKVCCGDNHNIVLMTTGEAYVWGSNANGQFKQINYQYFSQPTLLKLGSESSILDVAASGNATSVIVSNPVTSGSTESHTVFHFSKVHSEAEDSPTIQINEYSADNQNNAEECPQLPLNLYSLSCGSQLVLSSRPNLNSPSSSHSEVSSSNLMKMIKTTKVSVNLLGLLDRILEQNQYPSSETSTPPSVETLLQLLGDLRSALLHWSLTLSHITQTMFHILKTNPEKAQISQLLTFSAVMRILVRLHLAYIDAVGYGCFFDVDIGPELESYIERLSLDYEAESSKQYRRLRNLFNVPFKNFSGIRHVMASVLSANLSANYWKVFEHVLEKNEAIANKTCNFFQQSLPTGGFDKSLRAPHRLLVWSTDNNSSSSLPQGLKIRCEVSTGSKASSSILSRSLLGRGWLALIIFTNSIALIQKHECLVMEYPLLWVSTQPTTAAVDTNSATKADDERVASNSSAEEVFSTRIIAPEYEFYVEFPNFEMKKEFLESVSMMKKYKQARQLHSLEPLASEHIALSANRYGRYNFSHAHPVYKGAIYEGSWRAGLPHGIGTIIYPNGKEYHGRFCNGVIHGLGQMRVPLESIAPSPLISSVFFTSVASTVDEMETALMGSENSSSTPGIKRSGDLSTTKHHLYKGQWRNGKVHGLASISWANGDTFEGYCRDGQPHGHGVLRSVVPQMGQILYVGSWENGVKQGYGVQSTNRERYLGMWMDEQKHGKGCLISIDGTYHEGIFERNRFVRGRVVYEHTEGGESASRHDNLCSIPAASFEGEFDKIGFANGKGVLQISPYDKISGTMYGNILSGELRITNAVYSRGNYNRSISGAENHIVECEPIENQWAVPAEVKWVDLFTHFLEEDYGDDQTLDSGGERNTSALNISGGSDDDRWSSLELAETEHEMAVMSKRAWGRLVATLNKLRIQKGIIFDDRLERIPTMNGGAEWVWSSSYYAMVTEYWHLCISSFHHPLNRLVRGVVEVFCQSYNNIGTHSVMYDAAILEFQSLIRRTYHVVRQLFNKLPPVNQMYTPVPTIASDGQSSMGDSLSLIISQSSSSASTTSTEETLSIGSLANLANLASGDENSPSPEPSTSAEVSKPEKLTEEQRQEVASTKTTENDFQVATPSCDFIIHHLFSQCYAELFIMYSVRCQEMDKKYWERVVYLNAYTDARLLKYLEVKSELWPMDTEGTKDMDKFTVRVTARRKFYESAIHTFQRLSGVFNPVNKLAILAETFSEISACVSQFSPAGRDHVWTGDELLPAFIYVVVRAQLQHLGAEIRLISDFCPQLLGAGQIELMFTNLRAAYVQICTDKSNP